MCKLEDNFPKSCSNESDNAKKRCGHFSKKISEKRKELTNVYASKNITTALTITYKPGSNQEDYFSDVEKKYKALKIGFEEIDIALTSIFSFLKNGEQNIKSDSSEPEKAIKAAREAIEMQIKLNKQNLIEAQKNEALSKDAKVNLSGSSIIGRGLATTEQIEKMKPTIAKIESDLDNLINNPGMDTAGTYIKSVRNFCNSSNRVNSTVADCNELAKNDYSCGLFSGRECFVKAITLSNKIMSVPFALTTGSSRILSKEEIDAIFSRFLPKQITNSDEKKNTYSTTTENFITPVTANVNTDEKLAVFNRSLFDNMLSESEEIKKESTTNHSLKSLFDSPVIKSAMLRENYNQTNISRELSSKNPSNDNTTTDILPANEDIFAVVKQVHLKALKAGLIK